MARLSSLRAVPPAANADSPAEPVSLAERLLHRLIAVDDRRDSLVATIAGTIGKEIIEGALLPGDDLNSVDLAARFSTSRAPVREALFLLAKEGLVEIPARRRSRVASISPVEVREIYQVRAANLAFACELIATNCSDADIARLRRLLDRMQESASTGAADRYFWANVAFHQEVAEVCGNRILARIIESQSLRTLQLRHASLSLPDRVELSLRDHARLMRAIEERDPVLAGALVRSIVLSALAALERDGWVRITKLPAEVSQ